jgi:hypothetical protein
VGDTPMIFLMATSTIYILVFFFTEDRKIRDGIMRRREIECGVQEQNLKRSKSEKGPGWLEKGQLEARFGST